MVEKMQAYIGNTGLDIEIDRYEQQEREDHSNDPNHLIENSGDPWYFGFNYNGIYFDEIFWSGLDLHTQFQACISDHL